MTTIMGEACEDAFAGSRLYRSTDPAPLTVSIRNVLTDRLELTDPLCVAANLGRLLADEPLENCDQPLLSLSDIRGLAAISANSVSTGEDRLGALTLLSCLASAYTPEPQVNAARDILSSASYSVLRRFSIQEDTKHGRFAVSIVKVITDEDLRDELHQDAAELLEEVADVQSIEDGAETEAKAYRQVLPIDVGNLTNVVNLSWMDSRDIPEPFYGELVTQEQKPVALLCNLTGFNRTTDTVAMQAEQNGKRPRAWQYAVQGVIKVLQGQRITNYSEGSSCTIFSEGNSGGGKNEHFVKVYFVHVGHQDGLPIYGVVGMANGRENHKRVMRTLLPFRPSFSRL